MNRREFVIAANALAVSSVVPVGAAFSAVAVEPEADLASEFDKLLAMQRYYSAQQRYLAGPQFPLTEASMNVYLEATQNYVRAQKEMKDFGIKESVHEPR